MHGCGLCSEPDPTGSASEVPPARALSARAVPQELPEAPAGRSAQTLTSPLLFTGTLLDPEGLYDEEVCTPDNLQKYAIPNPPTCFRQFLQKPIHRLLFNISQVEGCFMDIKEKETKPKQTKPQPTMVFFSLRSIWGKGIKGKEKWLLLKV